MAQNPLLKNESAVLSFVTTLIGGVHANAADRLDQSVLSQLSMTSLYAHIEEQLGRRPNEADADYDKAWLRTKVDQIMFRNTTGASVVESSPRPTVKRPRGAPGGAATSALVVEDCSAERADQEGGGGRERRCCGGGCVKASKACVAADRGRSTAAEAQAATRRLRRGAIAEAEESDRSKIRCYGSKVLGVIKPIGRQK